MSYDFHGHYLLYNVSLLPTLIHLNLGAWETVTGLNAPLYAQSNETPDKRLWNVVI